MAVAVAERGLKRICPSCGTRYYDFNKRPVACPSCNTEFTGETKIKGRRGRAAAVNDDDLKSKGKDAVIEDVADQDIEVIEEEADTVSLDEVESMEEDAAADDLDDSIELDDDLEIEEDALEDADLDVEIEDEDKKKR